MRTISNIRWLGRTLRQHYFKRPKWDWYLYIIHQDIGYVMSIGERTKEPTRIEIWVKMVWEHYFIIPYWIIRQHYCRHPRWVDESYGNEDSGGDGGHCPDCHFTFYHTYY